MSNEMPKEIRFTNGSMDGEVWDTAEKGCPPDTVDAGGESGSVAKIGGSQR